MNRRDRRAAQRQKRRWLRGVMRSDMPDDVKQVARVIHDVSDDDGHFYTIGDDDGGVVVHPGSPS